MTDLNALASCKFARRENPGRINSVRDHFKIQMADRWMTNSIRRSLGCRDSPKIAFRKKNEILNFDGVDLIARYNEAGQFSR